MIINGRDYKSYSVYELYSLDETVTYFKNLQGTVQEYCTAGLQLPRMISKIWTTAIVSEKPKVTIKEELYDFDNIYNAIKKAVEKQFAFGVVAIVPKKRKDDRGHFFQVVSLDNCSNLVYHNEDGLTKYLEFKYLEKRYDPKTQEIKEEQVTEKHYYDGTTYVYKKLDNKNKVLDEVEKAQTSDMNKERYMLPQVFELETTEDIGKPIWLNAYKSINDCNLAYSELLREMKLARRVVGVPMHVASEISKRVEDNKKSDWDKFDSDLMMFTLLPGLPADSQTWQKFGGDCQPEPYLRILKFLFNQVSLLVGFGTNKLNEDRTEGAKTATEVGAEANTMLLNAEMIKNLFHDMVKYFVQIDIYMQTDAVVAMEDIKVTNSDSIFTTTVSKVEQLFKDMVAGVLPVDFYLKQIYTEDYEEIVSLKEEAEEPEEEASEEIEDEEDVVEEDN